jgi:hypothetical protein
MRCGAVFCLCLYLSLSAYILHVSPILCLSLSLPFPHSLLPFLCLLPSHSLSPYYLSFPLLSSVSTQAATTIRSIVGCEEGLKRYVLCVEHDLAVLDYLSGTTLYNIYIVTAALPSALSSCLY